MEQQARKAMLKSLLVAYQHKHPNWASEWKTQQYILYDIGRSWLGVGIAGAIIISTIIIVQLLRLPNLPSGMMWGAIIVVVLAGISVCLGIIWIRLNDTTQQTIALEQRLLPQLEFQISNIHDPRLKEYLYKGLKYWILIEQQSQSMSNGAIQSQLTTTKDQIMHWLQTMYQLAKRIDGLMLDPSIQHNLQRIPALAKKQASLSQQMSRADHGPDLQIRLEQLQQKLANIQSLKAQITQGYTQLDQSLETISLLHTQYTLIAHNTGKDYKIRKLQTEIVEETERLHDITAALKEVYG